MSATELAAYQSVLEARLLMQVESSDPVAGVVFRVSAAKSVGSHEDGEEIGESIRVLVTPEEAKTYRRFRKAFGFGGA